MIYLYSGTPGSGKSYHAVLDIRNKLRRKNRNRVIANFPISRHYDNFEYWDNSDICIAHLFAYAREHHVMGIEGQTLLVIDEAQCIFNSRDRNGKGVIGKALKRDPDSRMDWIKFFSQHRKIGYNVILIAQSDKMLDKQIRALIEYDVKHIKMNNGFFFFLPTSFMAVEKWYGQNMKLSTAVLWYRKRVAGLYDSYALFDALAGVDGGQGAPRSGGSPSAAQEREPRTADAHEVAQDLSAHFGPDVVVGDAGAPAARMLTATRRWWNTLRAWIAARLLPGVGRGVGEQDDSRSIKQLPPGGGQGEAP